MSHPDPHRAPSPEAPTASSEGGAPDFVRALIREHQASGRYGGRVATRFPPEPNGYLHIGHSKAICLNFGVAREFGGTCNLRFDDTNPTTEDMEYVEAMERDVRWLGFDWDGLYYASDYFDRFYELAEELVREGKAYVDSLSEEEIREYRGTVTEPGRESPYRSRSPEENLDLLRRMKAGEFPDGAHVLRAKADMAAANMKMRDPLLYRIRHAHHYRTGDAWSIYPMYDFAHPLSDALEDITHSLCTLEFENNREIYDWVVDQTSVSAEPRQYEFARLNLTYTLLSKRKLLRLVQEGRVDGWDDPRMPTLSGYRRRGYPPEAIRSFCDVIGVAKSNSVVDVALLEHSVRDTLNPRVERVLAVLRPLKLVVENYPEDRTEELEAPFFPRDIPREGSRQLPFSRELWIERDDFAEDPPKGWHRLAPGREVRLRYGYLVRCTGVTRDPETGEVTEVRCTYDPETRGGSAPDGRRVKGTLHWVSARHALPIEARLYDRLFAVEHPGEDYLEQLNPRSLEVLRGWIEPAAARFEDRALGELTEGPRVQFERQGYFYRDPEASTEDLAVWNRIVPLKDPWARQSGAGKAEASEEKSDRPGGSRPARSRGKAEAEPHRPKPSPRPRDPEALARFAALQEGHGLGDHEARVLAEAPALESLFRDTVAAGAPAGEAANWIVHELLGLDGVDENAPGIDGARLAGLLALVEQGTLTGTAAKEVLAELRESSATAAEIVRRKGLESVGADALEPVVDQVLAEHPDEVARYRDGQESLLGFFMGQVMRRTRGTGDPQTVRRLLTERLR